MPRGRKPKNQTVNTVDTDDNVVNTETKEVVRYAGEIAINHVQGDDYCTFYAGERKWYNWVLKLIEEHPDEITVIRHYATQDRSIEVQMPYAVLKYLRWPTKREMSDEQREAAKERMKKAQAARKAKKENN